MRPAPGVPPLVAGEPPRGGALYGRCGSGRVLIRGPVLPPGDTCLSDAEEVDVAGPVPG